MPYKHHDPVPESEMDKTRWEGHHSVCQTLRDIYHMTNDCDIRLKLRLAMAMTKAMNQRLQYYKHKEQGITPSPKEIEEMRKEEV